MKKFKLEIELENDAFQDGQEWLSVMQLLNQAANGILKGGMTDMVLRDVNGNKVGKAEFIEED